MNCGAIPEGTIDSELFGHEKGSFTGALSDRKGYFEVADGGTIFLDEVGELPTPTQARLLRVLETGEFIRVGSSKVQKTNVRIVAATNVNLTQAVADHRNVQIHRYHEQLLGLLRSEKLALVAQHAASGAPSALAVRTASNTSVSGGISRSALRRTPRRLTSSPPPLVSTCG